MKSAVAAPRRIGEVGVKTPRTLLVAQLEILVDSERRLTARDATIVQALVRGKRKRAYVHFPENDVRDRRTHSQFFFHTHPDHVGEAGHLHLFLRRDGIPPEVKRRRVPVASEGGQDGTGMVHLGAISLDRHGTPIRLFTTNLWVTGGDFYFAQDTLKLIDRFSVTTSWPSTSVNRWVSAFTTVFRGHYALLLERRDQVMAAWAQRHPKRNVFEARRLEIPSHMKIDYNAQIDLLRTIARQRARA